MRAAINNGYTLSQRNTFTVKLQRTGDFIGPLTCIQTVGTETERVVAMATTCRVCGYETDLLGRCLLEQETTERRRARWRIVWGRGSSKGMCDFDALADRMFALGTSEGIEASLVIRQHAKLSQLYDRTWSVRLRRFCVGLLGVRIVRLSHSDTMSPVGKRREKSALHLR